MPLIFTITIVTVKKFLPEIMDTSLNYTMSIVLALNSIPNKNNSQEFCNLNLGNHKKIKVN